MIVSLFNNPRGIILILALIVVSGLMAFFVLPRTEDPPLPRRDAEITIEWPGASAKRVESLITEKVENRLSSLRDVQRTRSWSTPGFAFLNVELQDDVGDIERAWAVVRDNLNDLRNELPPGALAPETNSHTIPGPYAILVAVTWQSDSPLSYALLQRFTEELQDRLRLIPGTAEVHLWGTRGEEVRIEIDRRTAAALNLSLPELGRLIRQGDAKQPAGSLRTDTSEVLIDLSGEIDSLDRLGQIPVATGESGRTITLNEVATMTRDERKPVREMALVNGNRALILALRLRPDVRIDRWSPRVDELCQAFARDLPSDLGVDIIFNQERYTVERLNRLYQSFVFSFILVIFVLSLCMGFRSMVAVGVTLPLCVLIALVGLRVFNIGLHQASIVGIILSLGMLIDNAIIVVDEIHHRIRKGQPGIDAITAAVVHLRMALFGSTMTTVLAFTPILLLPGYVGDYTLGIAVAVIVILAASLALAVTLTPVLCGYIKHRGLAGQPFTWWRDGLRFPRLVKPYTHLLRNVVRYPWAACFLAMSVPAVGFLFSTTLTSQFFPVADRDQFRIELRLSSHASADKTRATVLDIENALRLRPDVEDIHWVIGRSVPSFYYNLEGREVGNPAFAEGIVRLDSKHGYHDKIRSIQRQLDREFPHVQALAIQLEQGTPFEAPIELHVLGPDVDRLHELGERLRARMEQQPGVTHTRMTLAEGRPKLRFTLDEKKARLVGLDNVQVADQMAAAFSGRDAGSLVEGGEELPIRVIYSGANRDELTQLQSFNVYRAFPDLSHRLRQTSRLDPAMTTISHGGPDLTAFLDRWKGSSYRNIPLSSLGSFAYTPESVMITRRDGIRSNSVHTFIASGLLPQTVLESAMNDIHDFANRLPAGYRLELGGESAERSSAVNSLLAYAAVVVVLMLAALVMSLRSFRLVFVIALVGLASVGFGLITLWLFDFSFSFFAILGMVGLIGISINDSIVVLNGLKKNPAAAAGSLAAIVDEVLLDTRHVLTTTLTTLIGSLPLIIAGGNLWPPPAVVIGGGVVGSTMLALVFTPAAFVLLHRSRWARTSGAGIDPRARAGSPDMAR